MNAGFALKKVLREYEFDTVLDIGSGDGQHAATMVEHGKRVTAIDLKEVKGDGAENNPADYLIRRETNGEFDLIWCCHTLEHQLETQSFLKKMARDCVSGGFLAITVPPMKNRIVGGHVTLWNAGLLLYRLVLAGIDCREAAVKTEGYDASVIVRNTAHGFDGPLNYDNGDLEKLKQYFPDGLAWKQDSFDGDITELNW